MQKIILIAGPTGSGKSEIALRLAKKINGEIINADSMQVYKEIKILSARPENYFNITHYLYGSISIRNNFSAGEWLKKAQLNVKKIINKKKQPIFVGGTGLYFKLLTEGISNIPKIPDLIRIKARKLNTKLGNDKFYSLLIKLDPLVQNKIKKNDTHRLIRAYEVMTFTKKSLFNWQKKNTNYFSNYKFIKIYINPKNIFLLKLLRLRLKKMFEQGAVDEVKKFIKLKIDPNLPANKILGIEEINKYLGKKISLEQSFEETFIRTRRYVKRQRTWFRGHMKDWISIFHPNFEILTKKIINLVTSS
ncbi:MAG: tRNA (adenosine(37)-N6)-dimethylallyltransferase MiaA [Proteobacteria bacterium]|jgi:tRNA dimethylallyltransferase|nr:tRNA (adenosine(37)-N6)-dimethylallyltransferase MiaA [Candidatus Fonsibacter sp. PEL4]NBZ97458.1 tRNA (adenosine(37)-N6)-dimethylallyltransferase MiaA [Candidatus Fonsibacter sp. PEL4]